MTSVVKTFCGMCQCSSSRRCGLDMYVSNGKVVSIKGIRESPLNEGRVLLVRVAHPPKELRNPLCETRVAQEVDVGKDLSPERAPESGIVSATEVDRDAAE